MTESPNAGAETRLCELRAASPLLDRLDDDVLRQLANRSVEVVIPPGYCVIPTQWTGEDLLLVTRGSLAYGRHDVHARAGALVAIGGPCPGAGLPNLVVALTELQVCEVRGPDVGMVAEALPFLTDGHPLLKTLPVSDGEDGETDLHPRSGETLI